MLNILSRKSSPADDGGLSLDDLHAKRVAAIAARDGFAGERSALLARRTDLATTGADPEHVSSASRRLHDLDDSIDIASAVVQRLEAAIAPLQAQADARVALEQRRAAEMARQAAHDAATAAAAAIVPLLGRVCGELEQCFATLDHANMQLARAARVVGQSGSPLAPSTNGFMIAALTDLRGIPARLAFAQENELAVASLDADEKVRAREAHIRLGDDRTAAYRDRFPEVAWT